MINLATYNILHGHYKENIIENIGRLIDRGADTICLQEADLPFEKHLNELLASLPNWDIRYSHTGKAGNLATLWNTSKLKFRNLELILLPKAEGKEYQRATQVTLFNYNGKSLRVSNAHLAWEGGLSHRFKQLTYLKEFLEQNPSDYEVICGDFNTFAPAFLRNIQKNKLVKVLGKDWTNVFPNLAWSCDVSHSYPKDRFHSISTTLKRMGIRLRSCLDYVFVKNLEVVGGEMLDLPGSDHRPLFAKLK
ncbi:MAG: endonuclease/exonuclease/phosphatase family protein [Nanoarchaeota archaeon]